MCTSNVAAADSCRIKKRKEKCAPFFNYIDYRVIYKLYNLGEVNPL